MILKKRKVASTSLGIIATIAVACGGDAVTGPEAELSLSAGNAGRVMVARPSVPLTPTSPRTGSGGVANTGGVAGSGGQPVYVAGQAPSESGGTAGTGAGSNFDTDLTYLLDTDRDGVDNHLDLCPKTPFEAIVAADGCMQGEDGDGDGVATERDLCPYSRPSSQVDVFGCTGAQHATLGVALFGRLLSSSLEDEALALIHANDVAPLGAELRASLSVTEGLHGLRAVVLEAEGSTPTVLYTFFTNLQESDSGARLTGPAVMVTENGFVALDFNALELAAKAESGVYREAHGMARVPQPMPAFVPGLRQASAGFVVVRYEDSAQRAFDLDDPGSHLTFAAQDLKITSGALTAEASRADLLVEAGSGTSYVRETKSTIASEQLSKWSNLAIPALEFASSTLKLSVDGLKLTAKIAADATLTSDLKLLATSQVVLSQAKNSDGTAVDESVTLNGRLRVGSHTLETASASFDGTALPEDAALAIRGILRLAGQDLFMNGSAGKNGIEILSVPVGAEDINLFNATCGAYKVSDGAKCGWNQVQSAAKCGAKNVEDGAICGWDTVTSGAKCGWKVVTDASKCGEQIVDCIGCIWGDCGRCKKAKTCEIANTCKVAKSCKVANWCDDWDSPKSCDIDGKCDFKGVMQVALTPQLTAKVSGTYCPTHPGVMIVANFINTGKELACETIEKGSVTASNSKIEICVDPKHAKRACTSYVQPKASN